MAFFLTGALIGAAVAGSGNSRSYQYQNDLSLQSQTLQAQAETRALRAERDRAMRENAGPPSVVTVTIPAGVYAGQAFTINVTSTGQNLQVTVPPGYGPGMPLTVKLPDIAVVAAAPAVVMAVPVSPETGRQMWLEAAGSAPTSAIPPAVIPTSSSASSLKHLVVTCDVRGFHKQALSSTNKNREQQIVDETNIQYSTHQIISVSQGDVVELVDGTISGGLPAPYTDYVKVKTLFGDVGKVSKFCVQEI